MRCAKCERELVASAKFCRNCGNELVPTLPTPVVKAMSDKALSSIRSSDSDELVGTGISKVITGDGFLMVALFLSVTQTSVSSLLWLLLLLPAFYLFGQGFSDVFQARQIRRRQQVEELDAAETAADFLPYAFALTDSVTNQTTRKLVTGTSGKLGV
jgi:hypothetical protein